MCRGWSKSSRRRARNIGDTCDRRGDVYCRATAIPCAKTAHTPIAEALALAHKAPKLDYKPRTVSKDSSSLAMRRASDPSTDGRSNSSPPLCSWAVAETVADRSSQIHTRSLKLAEALFEERASLPGQSFGSFRKLRVPHFGVLIIRILLFRILY